MVAIERANPRLKGVLPKEYSRPALDKHRLGELIDLIGTIELIPRDSVVESAVSAEKPEDKAAVSAEKTHSKCAEDRTLQKTSSAAFTRTSSATSPAPKARKATSSTPRRA
jgi:hypothetical protein